MNFADHLIAHWPPLIDGRLVRSLKSDKVSNYFTQYLEWVMAEYVRKKDGLYLLREVECNNHIHKLDYLIGSGDIQNYLAGMNPKNCNWIALVEAQWGNSGLKAITDYLTTEDVWGRTKPSA